MQERRETRKRWVQRGHYAVEVEVEVVYPAECPSEACLEPATVRWLVLLARPPAARRAGFAPETVPPTVEPVSATAYPAFATPGVYPASATVAAGRGSALQAVPTASRAAVATTVDHAGPAATPGASPALATLGPTPASATPGGGPGFATPAGEGLAGAWGDDRLTEPLRQQIDTWVDGKRGALAAKAVYALAALGTDLDRTMADDVAEAEFYLSQGMTEEARSVQRRMQVRHGRGRCIGRRIGALELVGVAALRPEDVQMSVAGPGRHLGRPPPALDRRSGQKNLFGDVGEERESPMALTEQQGFGF